MIGSMMFAWSKANIWVYRYRCTTSIKREKLIRKLSTKQTIRSHFKKYDDLLHEYPLATKALTSGIIAGSSDAACQFLIEKTSRYDVQRTLRFGFLGMALVGPVCHKWYGFLAQKIPSQAVTGVATRVLYDQLIFAPLFLTCFCTSLWILEDRHFGSFSGYLTHLQQTMPGIVVTNWGLWIPSMALNFRYVPVRYQVLASNVIALVWNVYLSFKATMKLSDTKTDDSRV